MLASSDQELFVSIPILLALFIITRKRFNTLELNFFGLQKTKKCMKILSMQEEIHSYES